MKKRILAFCSALLLGLTVLSGCQSTPFDITQKNTHSIPIPCVFFILTFYCFAPFA